MIGLLNNPETVKTVVGVLGIISLVLFAGGVKHKARNGRLVGGNCLMIILGFIMLGLAVAVVWFCEAT